MSDILHISSLELETAHTPQATLGALEQALEGIPEGTDIVLLPELASTGFICNPAEAAGAAETLDGPWLAAIRRLSRECGAAICGTLIVREPCDGSLRNRAYFIEPGGDEHFYDKHHLFAIGGEDKAYSPGCTKAPVIRFRGWNITMAICFDLRFPAWLINSGHRYDLLLIPASWPQPRIYAWEHLLIARAIENQAYVAGCNRRGTDRGTAYEGGAMTVDFKGFPTGTRACCNGTQAISACLDRTALRKFRMKFPVDIQ